MTDHGPLVAPPGTRLDEPGWRPPWLGQRLAWGIDGEMPRVAVRRGDVLLATGVPPAENPALAALDDAGMGLLGAFAEQGFEDAAAVVALARPDAP